VDEALSRHLRRGCWLYPQPVAIAAGRILRSRSEQEQLDAILRCGEILARYFATLSLASFSARNADDKALQLPKTTGELSFGDFLSIVQYVFKALADHPLKPYLAAGFAKGASAGSLSASRYYRWLFHYCIADYYAAWRAAPWASASRSGGNLGVVERPDRDLRHEPMERPAQGDEAFEAVV
jgi:hypothetical protein